MPDSEPTPELSPLEAAEARRAARKAETAKAADAQRATDIIEIDALEAELGDAAVGVIKLQYVKGMPTCAAVRCPKPVEVKRFRDRVKPRKDGVKPDPIEPTEELAATCCIYPADKEVYAAMCQAFPGLAAQLGAKAVDLATGKDESEGKG